MSLWRPFFPRPPPIFKLLLVCEGDNSENNLRPAHPKHRNSVRLVFAIGFVLRSQNPRSEVRVLGFYMDDSADAERKTVFSVAGFIRRGERMV